MSETIELVDGQIYRWSWKDMSGWPQGSDPYWCKSRLAIVKNGALYDTYWHMPSWEHRLDIAKVDIEFFATDKWPKVSEGEALRYDPADIRSTRHSNNSRGVIFVRPGAQLNQAALLEEIAAREADAQSDIRVAQSRLEELAKSRAAAESGNLDQVRF